MSKYLVIKGRGFESTIIGANTIKEVVKAIHKLKKIVGSNKTIQVYKRDNSIRDNIEVCTDFFKNM